MTGKNTCIEASNYEKGLYLHRPIFDFFNEMDETDFKNLEAHYAKLSLLSFIQQLNQDNHKDVD